MAALLSSDIPGRNFKRKDSLVEHLEDCQRMSIAVLPPDVNRSGVEFTVAEGKICYGLSAIKGCGGAAAGGHRRRARRGGPLSAASSISANGSTRARSTARPSNRWSRPGPSTRSAAAAPQLFAAIDRAMQAGAAAAVRPPQRPERASSAATRTSRPRPRAATCPTFPSGTDRDRLAKEKEVLGFYLSSHPLAEHEARWPPTAPTPRWRPPP